MSTQITIEHKKQKYTLEYSRQSVKQMEQRGFSIEHMDEKPMTMIPMLFQGAFIKNHKGVKRAVMDEIYDGITDRFNEEGTGFIQVLAEMYAETLNTLIEAKEVDEGNAASWKVVKG